MLIVFSTIPPFPTSLQFKKTRNSERMVIGSKGKHFLERSSGGIVCFTYNNHFLSPLQILENWCLRWSFVILN